MSTELLAIVAVVAGVVIISGATVMLASHGDKKSGKKKGSSKDKILSEVAQAESERLFSDEFREELRNHGRLRFESIINENAMFLEQDLNLTIAQLNEYMKAEITKSLNKEFESYAKGMKEAQELALASLRDAATEVDAQRVAWTETLKQDVAQHEATLIQAYEQNMAQIVEHYVLEALGDQFDLKSQLPYIIAQMEANKQAIVEDMQA